MIFELVKGFASTPLTIVGIFLFQEAGTDWGGFVGAGLGFAGVMLGLWQASRSARLQRHTIRLQESVAQAKVEADKSVEQTKEVIAGWKELVKELKDGRKLDRQHIVICERQQQFMQAKLLEAGVFKAEDITALAQFELMYAEKG